MHAIPVYLPVPCSVFCVAHFQTHAIVISPWRNSNSFPLSIITTEGSNSIPEEGKRRRGGERVSPYLKIIYLNRRNYANKRICTCKYSL